MHEPAPEFRSVSARGRCGSGRRSRFLAGVLLLLLPLAASSPAVYADGPSGSTESDENEVTCRDGTSAGGVIVYTGDDGAELCNDGGAPGLRGRIIVATDEGYVAADGDAANPYPLDHYLRVDRGGAHCGNPANQDSTQADQAANSCTVQNLFAGLVRGASGSWSREDLSASVFAVATEGTSSGSYVCAWVRESASQDGTYRLDTGCAEADVSPDLLLERIEIDETIDSVVYRVSPDGFQELGPSEITVDAAVTGTAAPEPTASAAASFDSSYLFVYASGSGGLEREGITEGSTTSSALGGLSGDSGSTGRLFRLLGASLFFFSPCGTGCVPPAP